MKECPCCDGSGEGMYAGTICPTCHGLGETESGDGESIYEREAEHD